MVISIVLTNLLHFNAPLKRCRSAQLQQKYEDHFLVQNVTKMFQNVLIIKCLALNIEGQILSWGTE
jgi:hypothetical protein